MWNEKRDHVIARLELRNARSAFDDDARRFVAENRRELPRQFPLVDMQIGVTQPGRLHMDEHFACTGAVELHVFNGKGLIRAVHDGGADVQGHDDSCVVGS